MVAATLGANQDINAPILAFVAFKLAELLGDPSWNVKSQKVDTGVASRYGFTYLGFLDMAVARSGTTLVASCPPEDEGGEPRELWLRIAHDPKVRTFDQKKAAAEDVSCVCVSVCSVRLCSNLIAFLNLVRNSVSRSMFWSFHSLM